MLMLQGYGSLFANVGPIPNPREPLVGGSLICAGFFAAIALVIFGIWLFRVLLPSATNNVDPPSGWFHGISGLLFIIPAIIAIALALLAYYIWVALGK